MNYILSQIVGDKSVGDGVLDVPKCQTVGDDDLGVPKKPNRRGGYNPPLK